MSPTRELRSEAARPVALPALGYRLARRLSWAFVALAAVLAAVFVIEIAKFEATAPARTKAEPSRPVSDQIVATGSTLTGFDRSQEPYTVTAAGAVQDAAEPDLVHLETVTGELHRGSGDILTLVARAALYDSTAETLDLEGDVRLGSSGRFEAQMERAQVHLEDKRLRSEVPVVATFDRGWITAGGLEISDGGNRIVFFNRAKAVFEPKAKQVKSDRQP